MGRKSRDPLALVVEGALLPGQFIRYDRAFEFVRGLEKVKSQIDVLLGHREAERAVGLYEVFLAGCYEKAGEIDDSGGNLGMFFENLFRAWVKAWHTSRTPCERNSVAHLNWKRNDRWGLCYDIEKEVTGVLVRKGTLTRRVY